MILGHALPLPNVGMEVRYDAYMNKFPSFVQYL